LFHINKLLAIALLLQLTLACDTITPDALISSPDKTLKSSVTVSAQVATNETVLYTLPVELDGIYSITVIRKDGSDPTVLVCETLDCTAGVGTVFPDVNNTFDGTAIWYLSQFAGEIYIYVGGGDESKYSITATKEVTSQDAAVLSNVDTYGVVYQSETASYTLPVTTGLEYSIVSILDDGDTSLRLCSDADCISGSEISYDPLDPVYTADYTGTLYVFIDGNQNSIFHIQGFEIVP